MNRVWIDNNIPEKAPTFEPLDHRSLRSSKKYFNEWKSDKEWLSLKKWCDLSVEILSFLFFLVSKNYKINYEHRRRRQNLFTFLSKNYISIFERNTEWSLTLIDSNRNFFFFFFFWHDWMDTRYIVFYGIQCLRLCDHVGETLWLRMAEEGDFTWVEYNPQTVERAHNESAPSCQRWRWWWCRCWWCWWMLSVGSP